MRLQIDILDNQKIVAVWLTRAERDDESVMSRLRSLRSEYKAKKYTVAEYHSGSGDLHTSVLDLLTYNKRRIAELQVQREKAAQTQRPEVPSPNSGYKTALDAGRKTPEKEETSWPWFRLHTGRS